MFNRAIVTNISKYNLTEKANTSSFVKKNICRQNLNEIKKRYLIYSTRTLDLLCQVRACISISETCLAFFNLDQDCLQRI